MQSHNSEDTLHHYLRRHYERVSKERARQCAEYEVAGELDIFLVPPPAEASSA